MQNRQARAAEMSKVLFNLNKYYPNQNVIYTRYVYWRDFDRTTHGVMVDALSAYSAKFGALRRAVRDGYTRPRWWQFWRWNENKLWIGDCDYQSTSTFKADS